MLSFFLLIVAAILLAFAWMVRRASPSRATNQRFTVLAMSVACWAIGVGAAYSGHYVEIWARLAFASAAFITVSFLAFIAACAPRWNWPSDRFLEVAFMLSGVVAGLAFATNLIIYDPQLTSSGIQRKPGILYPLFAALILFPWASAIVLLAAKWRVARGRARAQLQYIGAGTVLPSAGGILTNLVWPMLTEHSTYSWLGPCLSLSFAAIVGHAIIRRRLTDLRLVVHRSLTVAVAIALSTIPMVPLLGFLWPRLLKQLDYFELGMLLIAVAVATILIPITRDVSSRLLDRYVYRTHANYQRTVREASRMLTQVLDLEKLLQFISTTVIRSTAVEGVALYVRESGVFRCAIAERRLDVDHFEAPALASGEIILALDGAQGPLLADEVARERDPAAAALHDRLTRVNWSLLLPVVSDNSLIAMIAVGPKLSGDAFYQQDLDLLMTLANQAGVAIRNAQLYTAVVVANEYLENIAATMESGVVAVDARGRVAMFNRAAERLTGLTETIRGGLAGVLPGCLGEPLLATVADGQPRTQPEVELPTTPGAEGPVSRPVICTVSPVRDPAGAVLGAVAVFSDLTPLKELEVERRRAERLAYFQALASGIAHEIKNPLVAIKTFTQLLPRRQSDARFLEEFNRIAAREIDRIQRLADRLRTLSRPAGGPRLPVDVRLPAGDALELVQPTLHEMNQTLTASLGAEPCLVLGNHDELVQLFLNLLLNAHDATPSGGRVLIDIIRTETSVAVAVSDTGPGISPELLERVFEPFFTTKARGSGLGLAISAGIAQAHGARLRAGNRPGGGAIFTVEFPAIPVVSAVVV